MKNEKSRPAEYRPTASGPMKLYLVRHEDGQEITVNGRNRYEAVYAALAAEEPILPLDTVYFSTGPYNDSIVAVIGNHYFCSIF